MPWTHSIIQLVLGQLLIGLLTVVIQQKFCEAFYRSIWMMPMISMSVATVWFGYFDPPGV